MSKVERRVYFDLVNSDMKPRRVDGQELVNWEQGPTMAQYIKQMQADGWRLVKQLSQHVYVFERDVS